MSRKPKGRKAWLITWDWAGDQAAVPEHEVIAAILRPQTSPESVKRIVELLYAAREYDAVDKLGALSRNPYPAEYNTVTVEQETLGGEPWRQRVPFIGQIHCGHNPFLYARLVDNLRPKDEADPGAGLVWDERPHPGTIKLALPKAR